MTNEIPVSTKDIVEAITGETVLNRFHTYTEDGKRVFTYETTWITDKEDFHLVDPEDLKTVYVKLHVGDKGDFEAYLGDSSGKMKERPFFVGNLSEVHGQSLKVEASAEMDILDWDEFFDFLDIPDRDKNKLSGRLDASLKESLARKPEEAGIVQFDLATVAHTKTTAGFSVRAFVNDPKKLVREAREIARCAGFDEDWLPGSLGDALCVIAITDNTWPCPSDIGIAFTDYTSSWSDLARGRKAPKKPEEPVFKAF